MCDPVRLDKPIPNAAEDLRNLQQLVASEPRTTLTILNRLDDVKQKLEKD
jgi:hypothetical protein